MDISKIKFLKEFIGKKNMVNILTNSGINLHNLMVLEVDCKNVLCKRPDDIGDYYLIDIGHIQAIYVTPSNMVESYKV